MNTRPSVSAAAPTFLPRVAVAFVAALGLAAISTLSLAPQATPTPSRTDPIVTLPTIVVVPDKADVEATHHTVALRNAPVTRIDEV